MSFKRSSEKTPQEVPPADLSASPETDSFWSGEVVPIPRLPVLTIRTCAAEVTPPWVKVMPPAPPENKVRSVALVPIPYVLEKVNMRVLLVSLLDHFTTFPLST